MSWQEEAERLKFEDGLSWSEVYKEMAKYFPDLSQKQIEERVRWALRKSPAYRSASPILVFSDVHAPFDHPNFPYFLQDTAKKYGCRQFVCLGDIIDSHAISNHATEPCALGAYTEFDLAIQHIKVYTALFPVCDLILGNHDFRLYRQAATVNIGERFLKPMNEILELPDTWKIHKEELVKNGVHFSHGVNWSGKNGALEKARTERMSACIGHSHSFGGVALNANGKDQIFGMNVGCGINREAYAFAYGRYSKFKETLGCGVVFSAESAIFVPMEKKYL